jgi:outer membrane protein OmpA-like peptidoglycan-associated protein
MLLLVVTVAGSGACAKKWQTGAVVGAGGGAVAGAAVGQVAGSTTKGAIIGAVVGGVAGGLIGREMDKRAAELRQNIRGAKVERVGEGIQVTFDSGLLFDVDSDDLRPEARTNLGELARSFDKYDDSDIMIVGHTDNTGTEDYNQKLSEKRADAAAGFLVDRGVSGKRIRTLGLGEMEPIATNESTAGRQENRRIEVAIYASKDMQQAYKEKAGS